LSWLCSGAYAFSHSIVLFSIQLALSSLIYIKLPSQIGSLGSSRHLFLFYLFEKLVSPRGMLIDFSQSVGRLISVL
ncbi:MAG: hypothetical protein ACR2OX_10115, partial [Methyloligellaceae bacterium]